jgi:hypothetical protein
MGGCRVEGVGGTDRGRNKDAGNQENKLTVIGGGPVRVAGSGESQETSPEREGADRD